MNLVQKHTKTEMYAHTLVDNMIAFFRIDSYDFYSTDSILVVYMFTHPYIELTRQQEGNGWGLGASSSIHSLKEGKYSRRGRRKSVLNSFRRSSPSRKKSIIELRE